MNEKSLIKKSLTLFILLISFYQFLFGDPLKITSRKILFKGNPATTITISPCAGISGKVVYYRNDIELSDIFLKISEDTTDSALTDTSGLYKFRVTLMQDYAVTPEKPDTSLTGISAYDASLILRYSSGKIVFDTLQKIAGDVSGNEQVTSYDASVILRRIVDKIDSFPSGPWRFEPEGRSYTHLNYSPNTQNYTGIKKGDPSGNWSDKGTLMSGGNSSGRRTVQVREFTKLTEQQDSVRVLVSVKKSEAVIKLKNINNVSSAFLKINYNSEDIVINNIVSLVDNSLLDWNESSPGVLKIALAGQETILPDQEFIRITFSNQQSKAREARFDLSFAELDEDIILTSKENTIASQVVPLTFGISEGYPNPFKEGTIIRYQIADVSKVSLKVFDVSGRVVKNLIKKEMLPGFYSIVWNGDNNNDKKLAGGVYFLDFTVKSQDGRITVFKKTRKLLLVK